MTLFRNGGAFFVDVRTEKEFLKRAIPGCPLVPLDKLEREGGLDSRFSGRPVVFFCRSGSRTQNKAELLERSASGKAYQLGGGFSPGNRRDFRFGAYASCCPVLRRNRLLSPGFLPDSCILSEPCPFRPPFSIGTGGFFMPFLRGNSPKRLAALDRKQEMFSNVGRGRECRPLHVAPLPAFVMVSVICCYYGLLFEKSESIASTRKSGSS